MPLQSNVSLCVTSLLCAFCVRLKFVKHSNLRSLDGEIDDGFAQKDLDLIQNDTELVADLSNSKVVSKDFTSVRHAGCF